MTKKTDKSTDVIQSADENQKFPLRGFYFVIVSLLTILSPINFSIQNDDIKNLSLSKFSAAIQVNSITLTLLFLLWLPMLIPWIMRLSPRIQEFLSGLREGGIEEIEAGILRIKLSAGVEKAADFYESKVLKSNELATPLPQDIQALEKSYKDTVALLDMAKGLSSADAMSRIDELCLYYDRVRETMPSGHKRSQVMKSIEATIWSLLPNVENFPVRQRLNSTKGGERLSAYKYLELQPNMECLDLLLARAIGVLEVPFSQYAALLALRRTVIKLEIDRNSMKFISENLKWNSKLEFLGDDRRALMKTIVTLLEQKAA
ncbi:MAG: hypothetical protein L6461_19200 [Anaerolineae bacterium]|nr:hypothetical protein [Anaerolineae bacterium]